MKFDSDLSIASSLLSPHRLNRSDIGVGFWQPSQLAGLWQSSGDTIVALGSGNPRAGWTRTLSLFLATSTLLIQDRLQLPVAAIRGWILGGYFARAGLSLSSGLHWVSIVFGRLAVPALRATFCQVNRWVFMWYVHFRFTLINQSSLIVPHV